MYIDKDDKGIYCICFDEIEIVFLENEAKENNITIPEMLTLTISRIFIGGYSNIIGKDE